jgi:hypothetical protein
MKYENPDVSVEWLTKEFFNLYLVALTQLGKPIKAQELSEVLKLSKKMASKCVDVVRNDLTIQNTEEASIFWNAVYHKLNS